MQPKPDRKTQGRPKKPVGDEIFDDFDAFVQFAQNAFGEAVTKVAADNAELGLPIYGADNGRLVTRQPTGRRTPSTRREPS